MSATLKSFAGLHEAYAFFQAHSTEASVCKTALLQALKPEVASRSTPFTLADYGCGEGNFSSQLLQELNASPDLLSLVLIEPDLHYRNAAVKTLSPFTRNPIRAEETLIPAKTDNPSPDLLIANHVFYYVPNLIETVTRILDSVKTEGLVLLTLANSRNALLQGWEHYFASFSETCPFHTSEKLAACLQQLPAEFSKTTFESELSFPDSRANRTLILKFMMGEHLLKLPQLEEALNWFDRFKKQNSSQTFITMPLSDDLYQIRSRHEIRY